MIWGERRGKHGKWLWREKNWIFGWRFFWKNLSEAELDCFPKHAISRYQVINFYKLAVQILGDGASDKEKKYLTKQLFSDSIEKMESLL